VSRVCLVFFLAVVTVVSGCSKGSAAPDAKAKAGPGSGAAPPAVQAAQAAQAAQAGQQIPAAPAAPLKPVPAEFPDVLARVNGDVISKTEFERARAYSDHLKVADQLSLVASEEGEGPSGSEPALTAFIKALGIDHVLPAAPGALELADDQIDSSARQRRQVQELVDYTQQLMRHSAKFRDDFWSMANRSNVESWIHSAEFYRNYVWEEMIGKLPPPLMPPNVRTRRILDDSAYTGFEVVIDVYPDGKAYNLDETIQRVRYRDGYDKPVTFMEPGKVYKVALQPMTTSNYFAPGHRIRIEVSSSNFPRFDRNLNTGGKNYDETTGLVAKNVIHHSKQYPSSIKITVVKKPPTADN